MNAVVYRIVYVKSQLKKVAASAVSVSVDKMHTHLHLPQSDWLPLQLRSMMMQKIRYVQQ